MVVIYNRNVAFSQIRPKQWMGTGPFRTTQKMGRGNEILHGKEKRSGRQGHMDW